MKIRNDHMLRLLQLVDYYTNWSTSLGLWWIQYDTTKTLQSVFILNKYLYLIACFDAVALCFLTSINLAECIVAIRIIYMVMFKDENAFENRNVTSLHIFAI